MNIHQKKPVGQPRVASLNDRVDPRYQPSMDQRDEQTVERWYCQVKETKRDGTGAGSLSTPIVPEKVANHNPESHWRKGAWCEEHRHAPIEEQRKALGRKMQGHYGYFGITGNYRALAGFFLQVKQSWHKWLNRRSRGNQLPWELFMKLLERDPLPNPRIVHQYAGANP